MTFLSGFVSWNALEWVLLAVTSITAMYLTVKFASRHLSDLAVLFHGTAALMAGINLVISCLVGFDEAMINSDKWLDIVIVQFTAQSMVVNSLAAMAHFLLHARTSTATEDPTAE